MTNFLRLLFWTCILLIAQIPSNAYAGPSVGVTPIPDWVLPYTPSGTKPSSKEFMDGYYLSFLDRQIHLEKQATYYRLIREIATESGVQNGSEVSVTFDPSYEAINFHHVTIWRGGVATSRLVKSEFKVLPQETDRERFIYNGNYSATLVLKDVRKGDRIEIDYTRTGRNPVFQGKFATDFYFSASDFVGEMRYVLIASADRKLQFSNQRNPPVAKITRTNGLVRWEWSKKGVQYVKYEDNTPSWYDKEPVVRVSDFGTWEDVVKWGSQFYKIDDGHPSIQKKYKEFKSQAESEKAYVKLATRFVQDEIRYLGVETGVNSHKPHAPVQVLSQRYGDCKDKTMLLCALLQAYGLRCEPVLINTYTRGKLREVLPSAMAFNHVITRVWIDGRVVYIDPTYSLQGGDVAWSFCPAYALGLPLGAKSDDLVDIPLQSHTAIEATEEFVVNNLADTSSKAQLMVKTVYHGGEADDTRGSFQSKNLNDEAEAYLDYYRKLLPSSGITAADTLEYYDQRDANNFSVLERYHLTNLWAYDSTRNGNYLSVFGKLLYDQLYRLDGKDRKDPISLRYPYHYNYRVLLRAQAGVNLAAEKWELKRESYAMGFAASYSEEEKAWVLAYQFNTLNDHVPVEQLKQYKADVDKLVQYLEYEFKDNESVGTAGDGDGNMILIVLRFVTMIAGVFLCIRLFRYSPGGRYAHGTGDSIGGWLVMLGVAVCLEPIAQIVVVASEHQTYYSTTVWNSLADDPARQLFFRAVLIFECMAKAWLFCHAVLLIVLFFCKRDSFKLMLSWFVAVKLLILVVDLVAVRNLFPEENQSTNWEVFSGLIRMGIFAAVWLRYLEKSERAARTFVNVYRGRESRNAETLTAHGESETV